MRSGLLCLGILCWLPPLSGIGVGVHAAEQPGAAPKAVRTTVKELLAAPKQWDGKLVEVEGKIGEYQQRTSARGHEYTMFRLAAPGGKERVAVFSFTRLGLADGKDARVRGLFQATKKVGDQTFRNEIDASAPRGSVALVKTQH